jgi:hypothetical protein
LGLSKEEQLSYRGKKVKKKKKPVYPTEKTTWSNFSKSVRLQHLEVVLDCDRFYARCVTCGSLKHVKELDGGHWMKIKNKATKFDRKNVHPQCTECNKHKKGEEIKHEEYILKTYGKEVVEDLKERAGYAYFKIPGAALKIINDESKEIINRICAEKGIEKW